MTTKNMQVSNVVAMLDAFVATMLRTIGIREITQNSIEAGATEILFDSVERFGVQKLSIVDNGKGMIPTKIVSMLSSLFASGEGRKALSKENPFGNFGWGLKVACAPFNKVGIEVSSWVGGNGYRVVLVQKGKDYVIQPVNGRPYVKLTKADIPAAIKATGHGTQVVLYGNSRDEDTTIAWDENLHPDTWISQYLSSRYANLKGVNIQVKAPIRIRRSVKGHVQWLKEFAAESGTVRVTRGSVKAKIHWFVVGDKDIPAREGAGYGSVAIMHGNEIYSLERGRSGQAAVRKFGVTMGAAKVALVVEPEAAKVLPNPQRTVLSVSGGEDLPVWEWEAFFRDNLPEAIRDLQKDPEYTNEINDRIRELMLEDMAAMPKLRTPFDYGQHLADMHRIEQEEFFDSQLAAELSEDAGQVDPVESEDSEPREASDPSDSESEPQGKDKPRQIPDGVDIPADEGAPNFPLVKFESSSVSAGYAVAFEPAIGVVYASEEFGSFVQLKEMFVDPEAAKDEERGRIAMHALKTAYGYQIVATIVGVHGLYDTSLIEQDRLLDDHVLSMSVSAPTVMRTLVRDMVSKDLVKFDKTGRAIPSHLVEETQDVLASARASFREVAGLVTAA